MGRTARSGQSRPNATITPSRRRMPSRLVKRNLRERLQHDTQLVNNGRLLSEFRKQGYYEELPLEELQDRLSKLQTPLAEVIMKGRA